MDDILKEFCGESKELIGQMTEILEKVEEDPTQLKELEGYGQIVDRIMGSSKLLALDLPQDHAMHTIANFTELCKLVGYKASQTTNNPALITVVLSFLMDATETLGALNTGLTESPTRPINQLMNRTFLDRLRWLAGKFDENLRASVAVTHESAKSTQDNIDEILKQMGLKL